MCKFIRGGLFMSRDEYSPPKLVYSHTRETYTVYYNLLAETNGIIKYPAALGRSMLLRDVAVNNIVLPKCPPMVYLAPLPRNILKSPVMSPLSANQTLAINVLNIIPDTREYSREPVRTETPHLINAIIKLGTGQGKTRLIGAIINNIGKKAIIVVNQIALVKQTVAELSTLLPAISIGFYYGAKQHPGDILVTTHKSLCLAKLNGYFKFGKTQVVYREFISEIGTICYDEIHTYCTPKYWHIFEIGADNMIGFSATPEQCPHIMRAIVSVGDIIDIAAFPGYDRDVCKFALTVTFVEYAAKMFIVGEERNNRLDYHALMTHIRADTRRANMIIGLCRKLVADGAVIFVFCCVREYAIKLRRLYAGIESDDALGLRDYNTGESVADTSVLLIGDTPEDIQDKIMAVARTTAQVIFTTYGYSDTGLNISRANTCVLAEPRNSNMIQRTGRIMRADGCGDFRNVYDIIDTKTPIKNQYKKRLPAYNERCADFVVISSKKLLPV